GVASVASATGASCTATGASWWTFSVTVSCSASTSRDSSPASPWYSVVAARATISSIAAMFSGRSRTADVPDSVAACGPTPLFDAKLMNDDSITTSCSSLNTDNTTHRGPVNGPGFPEVISVCVCGVLDSCQDAAGYEPE